MSSRITKFTLWGTVVVGCVATLATSWYTVKLVDEQIFKSIEDINRSGVMRASWYPKSSFLFSRDGVLHLVFLNQHMRQNVNVKNIDRTDPEELREVQEQMSEPLSEEEQKPAEVFINISNTVLPLMLKGQASFDMSRGSLAKLVKQQAVPATLPLTLDWKFTAYNQALDLHLNMDEWMLERADNAVKMGALSATLSGNLNDTLLINYGWQGMAINGKPATPYNITLMPLEGNTLMHRFAGMWMSPEGHMTMTGMRFSSADTKGEMGKLQYDTGIDESASETGMTLNLKQQVSLSNFALKSPQQQFRLDDLKLGLNLTGLNKQGLEELAQQMDAKQPDFMQMMKSMNLITSKSVRLELSPLSVKLNNVPLTVKGKLETLPFEVEQLMMAASSDSPDPFKHLVQGDLTISAAANITQGLPAAWLQSLTSLQQQGFIKSDNNQLVSSALLRSGEVTVNGKVLPAFTPANEPQNSDE